MNNKNRLAVEKVAIVVSLFNEEITNLLLEGAVSRLKERGLSEQQISITKVPGAVEIPLVAKLLAKSKKYQAIICLGAVIRGETDHYDYVCQQVSEGCREVMMEFELPVVFGVLTTNNFQQAKARVGGKEGHKGKEVADVAIEMSNIMLYLRESAALETA